MSTALAIAGVTAVLRDLLNDGVINHNISGQIGSSVTVSVLSPDRVVPPNGTESSQINLFLYLVTPNPGWRNEGLASRDATGRRRLSNPPLALDLHYLLSVYSGGDLHAEILLGYAMQMLYETPVLTREMIRTALTPSPDVGSGLPPALRALADSGLQDQVELIKLTPQTLNTEEMSKLWTAMQTHFRPTAAYIASVVLIEAREATLSAPPVLTRGGRDKVTGRELGFDVRASLLPRVPTLTGVVPPLRQPVARVGDRITLRGHALDGTNRQVRLTQDRLDIDLVIDAVAPPGDGADERIEIDLDPSLANTLPVGIYHVQVSVLRPGDEAKRESNQIALTLAPQMTNLPLAITRSADGSASFTVQFTPALQPGQSVALILGQQAYPPDTPTGPVSALTFVIPHAPVGSHLARLRIDGIDSPIIDLSNDPPQAPQFLNQRVVIS